MTTLQYGVGAPRLSATELDSLLADLASTTQALAQSATVPPSVRQLVQDLPQRLHAQAPGSVSADAYLAEQVFAGAAVAAAALLDDDERAARRNVRLALEQVRQALRNVAELRPVGEGQPAKELVDWLEVTLGASQARLAGLVGTAPRTWQRWKSGDQLPDEVGQLRLRRFASVVAQLRFSLTAPGVLDWFDRPHPALKDGQATPAEQMDDSEGYRVVLDLAARLRTMSAT